MCIICVYIYMAWGGGGGSLGCMRLCGWRVFRMLCIFGGGGCSLGCMCTLPNITAPMHRDVACEKVVNTGS